ncbi:MAG: Flp family type IVb pilin [Devosia sp.]|jgi:pilus assembly protein Flp/PilA|nr:Flp family type IVb pilin [Alphaproteobacteria bacterium]MBU1561133.1 Flp family type IVb pilin [Alphaproteobacteria bacterium]MBU2302482.1 Flp family type IVb pilin [Alphaproteobacteria bacterium]MBU2366630.1 Flp family type IVb pilin [Alphaproteobacteria bacterium]
MLKSFIADETGATAIEYGLLAGLIAVAVIVSFVTLGDSLFNLMATGPGAAGNVIAAQTAKID